MHFRLFGAPVPIVEPPLLDENGPFTPVLGDGLDTITRWALPTSMARLAVATVAGGMLFLCFGWRGAISWGVGLAVSEFVGWIAVRPHRLGRASTSGERGLYVGSLLLMNAVWCCAAASFWLTHKPSLMLAGALALSCQMFHAQTFTSRSATAFVVVGGLPAITLLGLISMQLPAPFVERAVAGAAALCMLAYMAVGARVNRRHAIGLEKARLSAERANAAKTAFLATASHEIRTPVSAILAGADLLARSRLTSEQASQLELLHQGGRALQVLLTDLIDHARIEAGQLSFSPRPTDPRRLGEELIALWSPRAAQVGAQLELYVEDAVPSSVMLDDARVRQILSNLLSNAVKFAPGGWVRLIMTVSEGELRIEVSDSGAGIPPQLLPRLFEPYAQAGHGLGGEAGAGLGLAISRRLARLMEGDLTVSSSSSGATFRLGLPRETAPTAGVELRAFQASD